MGKRATGRRSTVWIAVAVMMILGTMSLVAGGTAASMSDHRFTAAADAYVDASRDDKNFGRLKELRMDSAPVVVSYLRFDVQGLTGDVASATLNSTL